jgi:sugar O-acyltransferase (sialic acid O-acetyltransferase NeuD family)
MNPADLIQVRPNSVAILGFHDGSAGQIECWFEKTTGLHIACFVHESAEPFQVNVAAENKRRTSQRTSFPQDGLFKGRPFLVELDWISTLKRAGIRRVLPLTPDNRTRLRQIEQACAHGLELVSGIHPTVTVLSDAIIEPGVWINAGSIIGYKAEIQAGVLINTGVKVDHHNVLETCCQVDPGAVLAGNVTLRRCCQVHTGATIINRIEIGEDAIIGAGAVVIRNIPPRSVAVGVPARVIKRRPAQSPL